MADGRHVYPLAMPEHVTQGFDCWCKPRVEMICPETDENSDEDADGCWRCGGRGWVPCDDPESYDGPHGLLIVHNDDSDG